MSSESNNVPTSLATGYFKMIINKRLSFFLCEHNPTGEETQSLKVPHSLMTILRFLASHSVMSDSLQLHEWQRNRLLCPWNSLGQKTKCFAIPFSRRSSLPRKGSSSGLLRCRWILYHLNHQGSTRFLRHLNR